MYHRCSGFVDVKPGLTITKKSGLYYDFLKLKKFKPAIVVIGKVLGVSCVLI